MLKNLIVILLWAGSYSCAFAQEQLIFAIDIIRHGDRTPIFTSPEIEKIWPQGVGQLTPKGMRQEYDLGKKLRKNYVDHYHLLPSNYDNNAMTVRSSGIPRTLMSAQSILYGLYPLGTGPTLNDSTSALPKGFQPIPITMVPYEQDSLLVPNHDKKEFKKLLATYIFNSPKWKNKDQALRPNYPAWSKTFKSKINTLFDLIEISDLLYIERLYHKPLPDRLTKKDADLIINEGKWALLYIANDPHLAAKAGNELAKTIHHQLTLATKQNRPLKYLLFVAHDTTILAQLKLLGQEINELPPYASDLNYSLFDLGSSQYEVRVSFNQKPVKRYSLSAR